MASLEEFLQFSMVFSSLGQGSHCFRDHVLYITICPTPTRCLELCRFSLSFVKLINGDFHTEQEKRHCNISKNMISPEKEPIGVRGGSKGLTQLYRSLSSAWTQLFTPLHPLKDRGNDIQGLGEVETILRESLGTTKRSHQIKEALVEKTVSEQRP